MNYNPAVINAEYAVRGPILLKALELKKQLNSNNNLPFNEIIECNIGNPQQLGQKPLTYFRQVLSLVLNPELIKTCNYSDDIINMAKYYLDDKNNIGAYTQSNGLEIIRNQISEFIYRRDGYKSDPSLIYLSNGASDSIKIINQIIIRGSSFNDGLLLPIPQYPLYSALTSLLNGVIIPYYLEEESGWSISISNILENYEKSVKNGISPRTIIVINPGNPTGNVLSKQNMIDIINFCVQKNLILQADEVYQDNIYNENKKFLSFKKVASEMGYSQTFRKNNLQLISYHSTSKGFYGECGMKEAIWNYLA